MAVLVVAVALVGGCTSGGRSAARSATSSTTATSATSATSAMTTTTTTTAPTTTVPTTDTTAPGTTAPTTVPTPVTTAPAVVSSDMLNPAVTPATISATICVSGYTKTIRPPVSFTDALKVHQIATYGYADKRVGDYEEDHVVALEIGGSPASPVNLFPETHAFSAPDDTLENSLHSRVCLGTLSLAEAQRQLLSVKVAHGYSRAASAA